MDQALGGGLRGLGGGSSLAKLMEAERGVSNPQNRPPFNARLVALWADAFFHRHGYWPTHDSGPIPEAPGETWKAADQGLRQGGRGFKGRSSLSWFLVKMGRVKRVPGKRLGRVGKSRTLVGN